MNITVSAVGQIPAYSAHVTTPGMENGTMYEMYPEWGPAQHDEQHPSHPMNWATPVQESMDLRDHGGERPDDN